MLTRPSEFTAAAARLQRLGMPEATARSVIVETLGLPSWEQAIATAEAGALAYPDTWVSTGSSRFHDQVVRYLSTLGGLSSELPVPSILDVLIPESPLSVQDAEGLSETDLIRRVALASSPYQLMPSALPGVAPGTRRGAERIEGGFRCTAQSARAPLAMKARLRADHWGVTARDANGEIVAALYGVLYTPLDRKGLAGEQALLAMNPESPEMICDLLSILGSLPQGRLTEPVSSADYLYVAPRARGARISHSLADLAAAQLQRVAPTFGEFRVDPYLLLQGLRFPVGPTTPSAVALRSHLEHHLLLPLALRLQKRRVGLRQRGAYLPLTPKQAVHLLGQLDSGRKLAEVEIPSAAALFKSSTARGCFTIPRVASVLVNVLIWLLNR